MPDDAGAQRFQLNPIGVIHSPYQQRDQAPRQGRLSENEATLEVFPSFAPALKGIEHCSHVIVLYWGDRANREVLQSPTPFSEAPVGVFASRSPNRPNPIAFCVADLIRREGNRLIVRGVDALDGSPLLDIKVYVPALDSVPEAVNRHMPADQEAPLGGVAPHA
ncbi:MAG: tRNA (N6-threonylcarbamoyladenosine(37)-N6)-methyltransferase TrmO [Anaerolineae bacterium]